MFYYKKTRNSILTVKSHAKFQCNRLTTVQDIQDDTSLIFGTHCILYQKSLACLRDRHDWQSAGRGGGSRPQAVRSLCTEAESHCPERDCSSCVSIAARSRLLCFTADFFFKAYFCYILYFTSLVSWAFWDWPSNWLTEGAMTPLVGWHDP